MAQKLETVTADLVTWLRATLDVIESDARSYIELQGPDGLGVDWALLALAEVEAKRRLISHIVDVFPQAAQIYDGVGWVPHAEVMLRLLALPYANEPGYREEWRP